MCVCVWCFWCIFIIGWIDLIFFLAQKHILPGLNPDYTLNSCSCSRSSQDFWFACFKCILQMILVWKSFFYFCCITPCLKMINCRLFNVLNKIRCAIIKSHCYCQTLFLAVFMHEVKTKKKFSILSKKHKTLRHVCFSLHRIKITLNI